MANPVLFDELLDKLPCHILLLHLENRKDMEFRLVAASAQTTTATGVPLKTFVGRTLRESFPEVYDSIFPRRYMEALQKQKIIDIDEIIYRDAVATEQRLSVRLIPLPDLHIAAIWRDISHEKAIEEIKRKNQELEQFTYITSHDLQEPMNTISGFAQRLREQYKDRLDAKADKYLDYLVEGSSRLTALITGLLGYSRIGHMDPPRKIECNLLLQSVLQDLHHSLEQSRASVRLGRLPVIDGYPEALEAVFRNLLSNAIRFSREGVPPRIAITARESKQYWKFSISDNGIGIESKHRERVFQIFQRLHNYSQYPGSGIGLAYCKKTIELHGGTIWVESEPGRGSTFYFTIKKP